MLEVQNVSFRYGSQKILSNFSLSVKAGEVLSIIGKSGVGKSTLFSVIAGDLKCQSGKVFVEQEEFTKDDSGKRPIVTMYQEASLFPHLTVLDNVLFGVRASFNKKRFRGVDLKSYAKELLMKVELEQFVDYYPHQLSGGQKQRVSLARCLAIRPKVLLMDEPLSALDPKLSFSLNILIKKLIKENNIAAIRITHSNDEAIAWSDKVILLTDSQAKEATPLDIQDGRADIEFINYFKNGVFIDNKVYLSRDFNESEIESEQRVDFKILSRIRRGLFFEYLLDFSGQELIYYSKKRTDLELSLYL